MKRAAVPLILFLFGFLLGLLCLFPMSSQPPDTAPALSVQGSGGGGRGRGSRLHLQGHRRPAALRRRRGGGPEV